MDSETKKFLKKAEIEQKSQETLDRIREQEKELDKAIEELNGLAKDELVQDNEADFELIGGSIFYFNDLKKMLHNIGIQFSTYMATAKAMESMDSVRQALKLSSKMLDSMPSMRQNAKDFAKFKRSLMKGQLNMKAFSSMMSTINPATSTSRTKEEFAQLRESLMSSYKGNLNVNTSSKTETVSKKETSSLNA